MGSTQQMNLRTAANVRPSLAVTVYAICGQIVKICVWQHNPAVAMEKETFAGDFTPFK